jgi:hypothetical protein
MAYSNAVQEWSEPSIGTRIWSLTPCFSGSRYMTVWITPNR